MKRIAALIACLMLCICLLPASAQQGGGVFYALGDKVADFTITDCTGKTHSLYGLLENHKAVLLNFWFAGCGPCRYEFPYLAEAYGQLGEDVAVLAISPYDSDDAIRAYQAEMNLPFPMASDTLGVTYSFVDYGFPTSVLIDRNGIMCFTECGMQTSTSAFVRLFTPYLAADYSAPLLLEAIPPQEMPAAPDGETLRAALNADGETLRVFIPEEPGVWPWAPNREDAGLISANAGVDQSTASVSVAFRAQAGDALAFRHRESCEAVFDRLTVLLDNTPVKVFSGERGWQRYALPLTEAGEHTVTFAFTKANGGDAGQDAAMLADVALLRGEDAAAAVAANPAYPLTLEGREAAALFPAPAREILFDDPSGFVDGYFGADGYYVLGQSAAQVSLRLGRECDPDEAFFLALLSSEPLPVSVCPQDETGFLLSLEAADTDDGFAWNLLVLSPSLSDNAAGENRVYVVFAQAEDADAFCQALSAAQGQTDGVSWRYAETQQEAAEADYTLRFSDQNGLPVAGVIANVCDEDTCTPMVSDENGLIRFTKAPYAYEIHVIRVPDGYAFDLTQDFTAPAQGGEMLFTLAAEQGNT